MFFREHHLARIGGVVGATRANARRVRSVASERLALIGR